MLPAKIYAKIRSATYDLYGFCVHFRAISAMDLSAEKLRNHAIDEFLVDLVNAEHKLSNRPDMIRIGGGAKSSCEAMWSTMVNPMP